MFVKYDRAGFVSNICVKEKHKEVFKQFKGPNLGPKVSFFDFCPISLMALFSFFSSLFQLHIFCFLFENKAADLSFNFIPTAFFYSLAVKSTDFLKLSYMEKVKVREQEKGGENDNKIF